MRTEQDNRTKVDVYANDPRWDDSRKWWNQTWNVQEAFIARYLVREEYFEKSIEEIQKKHPNCVLVYALPN